MKNELQELREEVARLRDRVAVLEAAPRFYPPYQPVYPAVPQWPALPTITWGVNDGVQTQHRAS